MRDKAGGKVERGKSQPWVNTTLDGTNLPPVTYATKVSKCGGKCEKLK